MLAIIADERAEPIADAAESNLAKTDATQGINTESTRSGGIIGTSLPATLGCTNVAAHRRSRS
jgi:hypothetical protein